jgi:photosystem II stability/assembly factor-like uncharacterized protein
MTVPRDLSLQLTTWLEDRATSSVPEGLLDRSLARVDATRQRPGWLAAHRRGSATRPVPLAFIPSWAILVLISLLAVAVVVAGSQLVRPKLSTITQPAPSPAPSATDPIRDTPIPTALDTRPPGITADASTFANIATFVGASDEVAWVSTVTHVYRTEDTGRTWRAVEPAGWTPSGTTVFLDADTAYFSAGGQPAAIYVTHDGGSSWTRTDVDAGPGVLWPIFSFQTPTTGFATFVDPALYDAPAGTGVLVFATTDGGLSWAGPTRGVQPHFKASMNKVYPPVGSFLVDSAGKGNYPFENWFFLSDDGGVTWTKYAFPIGTIAPQNALKTIGDIRLEQNGRLLIFLAVDGGPNPLPQAIYESTGDTSTWRLVYQVPAGDFDAQFLSDSTWVLTNGSPDALQTTTDAGAHWSSLTPSIPIFYGQSPESRQFATLRTAWATMECRRVPGRDCGSNPRATVLFVTKDGGATWTPIGG